MDKYAATNYVPMDEMTTRVHMNPREALGSLEHVRNKSFRNREAHVDGWDGKFELWKDKSVYDVYDELFGEHIKKYNENQKTKCRRIYDANGDAVGGYIEKIQTSRRGKRERVVEKNMPDGTKRAVGKRDESQGQRLLYEIIISGGNVFEKKRDENGRIVYTEDGHEQYEKSLPYEVNRAAVKEFCQQFEKFYPHLRLTTAAWHADEFYLNANGVKQFGTPHAHLCFVPWADGYKRGISVQQSISKALEQMGFKSGKDSEGIWRNMYWHFTKDAQEKFEQILQYEYVKYQKEHGVTIGRNGPPAPEGCVPGLKFVHPAEGKNLPNLDPAIFREHMDTERLANIAKKELKVVQSELDEKKGALEQVENTIAEAKENLDAYIALKRQEADALLRDAEEEADELIRDAEEKHKEKVQDAEQRFRHILEALKKISGDLEFYLKSCEEVLTKRMSLNYSSANFLDLHIDAITLKSA